MRLDWFSCCLETQQNPWKITDFVLIGVHEYQFQMCVETYTETRLIIQQNAGDETRCHPWLLNYQSSPSPPSKSDRFHLLSLSLGNPPWPCRPLPVPSQVPWLWTILSSHPLFIITLATLYSIYFLFTGPYSCHSRKTGICPPVWLDTVQHFVVTQSLFIAHAWTWKKMAVLYNV